MRNGSAGKFSIALAAIFTLAACTSGRAQFTTVAYDGFNCGVGLLAGHNGSTGSSSVGANDDHSGGSQIGADSRSQALMDGGIVNILLRGKFSSPSGGGTPNIRLFGSGAATGGNSGANGPFVPILNSSFHAVNDRPSASSANVAEPIPQSTFASLGIIGSTLVCGWFWRKPTRRTP